MTFALTALTIIAVAFILIKIFLSLPKFGRSPSGELLLKIQKSPNYRNNAFQNQSETPSLADGATYPGVIKDFFLTKHPRTHPPSAIPSKKTDLKRLNSDEDIFVWFGHSSYFLQLSGKKFLVDPVFSGAASPVKFTTRSFPGTDVYSADDIPEIDLLIITHDHWDHLDHETVIKLRVKAKRIVCGLGVSAHLDRWGFDHAIISELDWYEGLDLFEGFRIDAVPARHFSGRKFKRNQTLWLSFVLTSPRLKVFIGGDSGYDKHFLEAEKKHGPMDVAILECGQYNESWRYIHMLPEDVIKAAKDLNAKKLIMVHWGKFKLSVHPWDEPPEKISSLSINEEFILLTPMIGERTDLNSNEKYSRWWKHVR